MYSNSSIQGGAGERQLRAVPSHYAFNHEQASQRLPAQSVSEYQLPGLNSWQTATAASPYHYVTAAEVPRPTHDEQVIKGNVSFYISFSVLEGILRFYISPEENGDL